MRSAISARSPGVSGRMSMAGAQLVRPDRQGRDVSLVQIPVERRLEDAQVAKSLGGSLDARFAGVERLQIGVELFAARVVQQQEMREQPATPVQRVHLCRRHPGRGRQ
jgi:hypothetical protein